jgi:hypothetical protein
MHPDKSKQRIAATGFIDWIPSALDNAGGNAQACFRLTVRDDCAVFVQPSVGARAPLSDMRYSPERLRFRKEQLPCWIATDFM